MLGQHPWPGCWGHARSLAAYDSLGQMTPDDTARAVEASLARGFWAFKIKAGHADPDTGVAVIRVIREVAGPDTWVAADFNQAFSVEDAIARMQLLDAKSLAWIEEPVRAEDHAGHAAVRAAIATPVQTGENWWGIADMRRSINAGASDLAMSDVMKIGGVSGWMRAAALAAEKGLPVSSYLFAEISCHLLAPTPGAHYLEWLDVAGALNQMLPTLSDGSTIALDVPGAVLNWDEPVIARYAA